MPEDQTPAHVGATIRPARCCRSPRRPRGAIPMAAEIAPNKKTVDGLVKRMRVAEGPALIPSLNQARPNRPIGSICAPEKKPPAIISKKDAAALTGVPHWRPQPVKV